MICDIQHMDISYFSQGYRPRKIKSGEKRSETVPSHRRAWKFSRGFKTRGPFRCHPSSVELKPETRECKKSETRVGLKRTSSCMPIFLNRWRSAASLRQDELPAIRRQPSPVAYRSLSLQLPGHAPAILCLLGGGDTTNRVAHEASDQGRSESRVSRADVVCSCGVGVSLRWTLPRCVRVTSTDVKTG